MPFRRWDVVALAGGLLVVCALASGGVAGCAVEGASNAAVLADDGGATDDGAVESGYGSTHDAAPGSPTYDSGAGSSSCSDSKTMCPGVGCIDTSSDIHHCGDCMVQCSAPSGGASAGDGGGAATGPDGGAVDDGQLVAMPACVSGTCTLQCPPGPTVQACASGCFDTSVSRENCGSCGYVCASDQQCVNGVCCGGSSKICGGACVDLTQDPNNCGACGNKCPATAQCVSSTCVGYDVTTPAVPFVDACAATTHQTLLKNATGWEETAVIALPFSFTFFGQAQTQFWVGSQGTVGFGKPPTAAYGFPSCPLPDTSNAYPAIVAFGDFVDTSASGVCWAASGTAPNRTMAVTWSKASHDLDTGSVLTFSVVLTETTNTVDVVYQTATQGSDGGGYVLGNSATVGLQSGTGAAAQYACGQGSNDLFNAAPFSVHFAPLK